MCKLVFLNGAAYCETVCQCLTTKEKKTKGLGVTTIGKTLADVRKEKKLAKGETKELTPKQRKERKEKRKEKLARAEKRAVARAARVRREEKYLSIEDVLQESQLLAVRKKLPQVATWPLAFANARRKAYPQSRYMAKHGCNTQDVSTLKNTLQVCDDNRLQDVLMSVPDIRQRELVQLLASGYTMTEVAKARGVSVPAIHKQFSKILAIFCD